MLVVNAFSDEYKEIYEKWAKVELLSLESMQELVRRMENTEDITLTFDTGSRELNEIEQKYVNVVNLFLLGYADYYIFSIKMSDTNNLVVLLDVSVRLSEMIEQGRLIENDRITTEQELDEAYNEMYQYLD